MDPLEYLGALKRRWRLIATVVGLSLVAAWLSTSVISSKTPRKTFAAQASLIQSSGSAEGTPRTGGQSRPAGTRGQLANLSTIASLLRGPEMTARVAKITGYEAAPQQLTRRMQTSVDPNAGLLTITVTGNDGEIALKVATTYATEFLKFLTEREAAANAEEANAIRQQIGRVRTDIAALDRQIARYQPKPAPTTGPNRAPQQATSPADSLITERAAALRQLGVLSDQYQEIRSRVTNAQGLSIFEPARLMSPQGQAALSFPRPLGIRMLLGLVLGTLVGLALALVRDRFDRRIRSKEAFESHFGFPVVAEIPPSRRRAQRSPPEPSSMRPHVADAFRLLGAGLNGVRRHAAAMGGLMGAVQPRVILVTSAGPGEGKTTVVASLATTLADSGKVVTVLACDFRHPDIDRIFGVRNRRGISDAARAESNGEPLLNDSTWLATTSGVWVVPTGTSSIEASDLLGSPNVQRVFSEARQRSDVVLVDTSPVLTSEVAYLIPEVDTVLVVARAGYTTPELAERSGQLLRRLGAPVEGVVLIGDTNAVLPRGYYNQGSLFRRALTLPAALVRSMRMSSSTGRRRGPTGKARGIPQLSRRSTSE